MKDKDVDFHYEVAEGPEGLWDQLIQLLERCHQDPSFVKEVHYILYQLGAQQSLIKIDTNKTPFEFWYCDMLGRPPTIAVKETIARFLWEKCGEKERLSEAVD